jgi:hypothetical protein
MVRDGLISLGIGAFAILLVATGVAEIGPCGNEIGGFLTLNIFIAIPVGLMLLLTSGIRAAWHHFKHPELHHSR